MRIRTVQITFRAAYDQLNDVEVIESILKTIATNASLQIVDHVRHSFTPQGHSSAFILSESHIAAHTWPESETAYITLSSCSDNPLSKNEIAKLLQDTISATKIDIQELDEDV